MLFSISKKKEIVSKLLWQLIVLMKPMSTE